MALRSDWPDELTEGAGRAMSDLEQRIAGLSVWQGMPRIEPLLGGLSNLNFMVTDGRSKYVVRSGKDFPFHHVYRDREVMTARAAHAAGFSPEVVHAEAGLMVSRFIDGKVLSSVDVRQQIEPIARFLRRFHDDMPARITGTAFMFWVFQVIRDYANTLHDAANPLVARLPDVLRATQTLEQAQSPLPICFGHNDLLPANFIDDGKRLWLIDFEYAGFGTAVFDLGGIASNAEFRADQSEALLTAYFGVAPSMELRRSQAAMQCAALLREALWGLVSEIYLNTPGVDYNAYAIDNFARFDAAYAAYQQKYGTD